MQTHTNTPAPAPKIGRALRDTVIKLNVHELEGLSDFVQTRLDEAKAAARVKLEAETKAKMDAAQAEIAAMIEKAGFNPDTFFKRGGAARRAAAKYVNPANADETWAGTGRKPNWLVAAIKGGAKLEDFEAK